MINLEENQPSCDICHQPFDSGAHTPYQGLCGHTLCLRCSQLIKKMKIGRSEVVCPKCKKFWGVFDGVAGVPLVAKNYYIIGWIEDMRTKPSTCSHEKQNYFCMDSICNNRSWTCIKCVGRFHANCPEASLKKKSQIKVELQGEKPHPYQLIPEGAFQNMVGHFLPILVNELQKLEKDIVEMTKGILLEEWNLELLKEDPAACANHFIFSPSSPDILEATHKFSAAIPKISEDIRLALFSTLPKKFKIFMNLMAELIRESTKQSLLNNAPSFKIDSPPQSLDHKIFWELLRFPDTNQNFVHQRLLIEGGLKPLPTWGSDVASLIWRSPDAISPPAEKRVKKILSLFDNSLSQNEFFARVQSAFKYFNLEWKQLAPDFVPFRDTVVLQFHKWKETVLVVEDTEEIKFGRNRIR